MVASMIENQLFGSGSESVALSRVDSFEKQLGEPLVRFPSVRSARCPAAVESATMQFYMRSTSNSEENYPKARGIMLAHSLLWDEFLRKAPMASHVAVFEDDALMSPSRRASFKQAMCYAQREGNDLTYLGWCMKEPTKAPFCTHGYIVSREGAEKLRDKIDNCGPPIDMQMRNLAHAGELKWDVIPSAFYAPRQGNKSNAQYEMCSGMVLQPWCPQFKQTSKKATSFLESVSYMLGDGQLKAAAPEDSEDGMHTRLLRTDQPLNLHRSRRQAINHHSRL
jgi:GR25 family glycosyltransferase involved in LPS biosynthesis